MFTKLLSFGDSWAYGSELPENSKTYNQLIADKFNVSHACYAIPATSVEHLLLQLKTAINQEVNLNNSLAIFTLTSPTRSIYFDNGIPKEIHIRNEDLTSKNYFKYQWSDELDYLKLNTVILALQKICKEYNIHDYYVCGFNRIDIDYPGIDITKIYDQGKNHLAGLLNSQLPLVDNIEHIMDFSIDKTNPFIFPNLCHPNQNGHIEIFKILYSWINNAYRKIQLHTYPT
jgi:hypothetical protein